MARSTFRSQTVQNTPAPGHFWKLRCRKIARRCGAKQRFEVKMYKTHQGRTTFRSWDFEKVHAIVARSTFRSQNVKTQHVRANFWTLRCRFAWQAGLCTLWKVSKTWGFCRVSKNDGRRQAWDTLKRICNDAFSVAGAAQETCSSELLRGPGADFLRRVAFWSLRSSGLLRSFWVTGAALRMTWHHFFVAGAII